MILRFLFYAFLAYMLYKLLFDFIIPVYRTTRRVRRGFREMNERMQQHTEAFTQQTRPDGKTQKEPPKPGDYIDFEEVKD